jgi:hypothetical protein
VRKVGTKIPMAECKRRALEFLAGRGPLQLANASQVAYHVWQDDPGVRGMRGQGAGLIGAKILRQLVDEGHVRWEHRTIGKFEDWGYQITSTGRQELTK